MGDLAKVFGGKARALRADRGLTQPQLADLADVSEQWVRRIEAGETSPSFDTIEALATALQTTPANLFTSAMPTTATDRFADAVSDLNDDELEWLIKGARLLRARRG